MSDDVTRVTIGNVSDTIKQLLFLATFKNGELVNSTASGHLSIIFKLCVYTFVYVLGMICAV